MGEVLLPGIQPRIFEYKYISQSQIPNKISNAVSVELYYLYHLLKAHIFRFCIMIRRFDEDLVCADAIHFIINSCCSSIKISLYLKDGFKARYRSSPPSTGTRFPAQCPQKLPLFTILFFLSSA